MKTDLLLLDMVRFSGFVIVLLSLIILITAFFEETDGKDIS